MASPPRKQDLSRSLDRMMIGHLSGEPDPRQQARAEAAAPGRGSGCGAAAIRQLERSPGIAAAVDAGIGPVKTPQPVPSAIMRIAAAPISAARPRRRPSGEISAATARNVLTGWRNQLCLRSPPSSSRSPASARYSSRLAHAATRHRGQASGRTGLSWPGPCVTSRRRAVSANSWTSAPACLRPATS
jgi:hypothetical protein